MNKTHRLTAIAVVVVVLVAAVCGIWKLVTAGRNKAEVDLYFINTAGTGIVSSKKTVKYRDDNELVYNTLEKLRRGPSSGRLGEVMSRDTEIYSANFDNSGRLTVEFSQEFLLDDPSKNVLNTYAVVKTLCSTACVSEVKVLAEGQPIRDRDGNALDFISASDINIQTEEYHSEVRQVALYFTDKDESKLVREMRSITITDQQPIEQYIINELIKGTDEKGLKSLLSDNTVLVSVNVEDNICYLNFKSGFLTDNSRDENHNRLVIYSIVNSLTELQTINRVQLYMDGKRVDSFGAINIKDYLVRNTSVIGGE